MARQPQTSPVEREPTREEIDQFQGPMLLEFGAEWCGHCQALAPKVAAMLAKFPQVRHIKVEDGKGKPLGRSFSVRLWPTFVFLRDGAVVQQVARPSLNELWSGLEAIS